MNTEEIIDMARQTGATVYNGGPHFSWKEAELFAKLVDAKATAREREACAEICEEGWKEGIGAKYQGEVFATAIRNRGDL